MTLATDGGAPPNGAVPPGGAAAYTSALDVAGTPVPSGDVPAEGAAPPLPAADEAVDKGKLDTALKAALIDAAAGATLDELAETVHTDAGAHVPKGIIEARLLEWEGTGIAQRGGDKWELSAASRAEVESPVAVVARRGEILGTLALCTMPDQNELDQVEGLSALDLGNFMAGEAGSDDAEGMLTEAGLVKRRISAEVLVADLEALVLAGILSKRTAADEDVVRGLAVNPADASDEDEQDEEEVDEEEEQGGEPVDARPAVYFFTAGFISQLLVKGATTLAATSIPAAAPAVASAAAASVVDGQAFQRRLTAELEAARDQNKRHEIFMLRLRTYLAPRKLEWMIGEVLGGPPAPPPAGVIYFPYTQTVAMVDREKVVLLGEIEAIERKIAEAASVLEGAKLALGSAKTKWKEDNTELLDRKRALLSEVHASTRTYSTDAYTVLDTTSNPPANITMAKDDNRVLKIEPLTPRGALEAMAKSEVRVVDGGASLAAVPAAELAHKVAVQVGGTGSVENGVPVVTVAPDAAASEAVKAESGRKAAGEAAKARSKGPLTISAKGLEPFVLAAIVGAGEDIAADSVPEAALKIAGLEDATEAAAAFCRLALGNLAGAGTVERRGDRVSFSTAKAIVGLAAEEGDVGLRVDDLADKFAAKTKCILTDAVKVALVTGLAAAVTALDLARGPLPGNMGELVWLAGEVDPRRAAPKADDATPPAPSGQTPEPRRRGGKTKVTPEAAPPVESAKANAGNAVPPVLEPSPGPKAKGKPGPKPGSKRTAKKK